MMQIVGTICGTEKASIIEVEGRIITGVLPAGRARPRQALGGRDIIVAPALFDIQVNGFQGHEFQGQESTEEDVVAVVRALQACGAGLMCPTVLTDSFEAMSRGLRNMRTACEDHAIGRCCPALHMEGPYISSQDGPRGAHPLAHTRKPDWDEFRRLQDAAGGRIGIVTLAPELPDAIPFIEKLSDAGIVPSIGHTNATAEDIRTAIAAGARLSTHLGNGAHAMLPRHPNYVWEQLAADELYASIIPDGQHLPPSVVKCIIRAKGVERTILISDATRHGGMPPGIYGHVEVRPNGRVDLRGTPYLAGSTLDLGGGVGNAIRFAGISLAQSVQMATLNPARLMNIAERFGTVEAGKDATLVLFTWDDASSSWSVRWTLVEGNVVYRAA